MKYKQIIEAITFQMTGDNKKDLQIFYSALEKYKNHSQGKEILTEIGRRIYSKLHKKTL